MSLFLMKAGVFMLQKFFRVELVTVNNSRFTFHLEADNVREIVAKLNGHRLTFIPRTKESLYTQSIYTHSIAQIQYTVVNSMGNVLLYDVLAD